MTAIASLTIKVKTKVKNLTLLLGTATVMSLGINASAMAAAMYDITELGNLGQPFSYPYDINDRGQVVGSSGDTVVRAFLWNRSTGMADLGTLSETDYLASASGINNAGQVVGSSDNRAFLWNANTGMTDFSNLAGRPSSSANAINNAGQIVADSNN